MKRLLLMSIIYFVCSQSFSYGQKVVADFSGVDFFWKIEEILSTDQQPDSTTWNQLFNCSFYAFYANWNQTRYQKRMITTAFMPSKKRERDSLLKLGDWNQQVIQHLLNAQKNRPSIDRYVNNLKKRDLFEEAKKKAAVYLPQSVLNKDIRPTIGFGIFQPQANANDSALVLDIYAYDSTDLIEVIGHELHHFYSFSLRKDFTAPQSDSAYLLLNTIYQLALEGTADLINADIFLKGGATKQAYLHQLYSEHYLNPSKNLIKIDSLLQIIADNPRALKENGKQIADLAPLGAHPHGFYMAKTILAQEGKKALLKTIPNPFDFLRLYNKAAKKSKDAFVFSDKSMNLFMELEKKYAGK